MRPSRQLRLILTSLGLVLSASAVVLGTSMEGESHAASATFPHRLTLPLVATDSVPPPAQQPTAAPTPTGTSTLAPSPTSTLTPTSTPSPTPTATPSGQSAYLVVQGWYNHINTTLYGQYSGILANQAAGLISMNTAGNQLTAFKPTADAYKAFLDGQGALLSNATPSCNQARQTLALAAGWLGLMAGWGGLILTGAGSYFAERQEASDNYFSMMSQALSLLSTCTGTTTGAPASPPSPSATTAPSTATPTPPGGGATGCFGTRTTSDWRLRVTAPQFHGDLFTVEVTPLTEEATESSFKVRVYQPNLISHDSSTKFFSVVGLPVRFDYGFDFLVSAPYPKGLYEVELRVDFLRETSLLVTC